MARVVHELQVDVGVVDRRVARERVVRDVERVIRPRRDREACLVGGVEDGRRDLADTATEACLQFSVDDHRGLEEALLDRALSGCAVEGEGRAGRDQLAVDQVGHELDVVDPVRVAAVNRLVGADRSGDPHRPRVIGRALRLLLPDHELRGAGSGTARRREHASGRARDVEHDARLSGHDANPSVRVDGEARVLGSAVDGPLQLREVAVRGGPAQP